MGGDAMSAVRHLDLEGTRRDARRVHGAVADPAERDGAAGVPEITPMRDGVVLFADIAALAASTRSEDLFTRAASSRT